MTPVGWNKLDAMVTTIFNDAGISGKTNHSLRVTGATRMYNSSIPEETIQTGHQSVEALRVYERSSKEQQAKACRALACTETKPVPATTNTALSDVTNHFQASVASVNPSRPNMPFPWGFNVPNFTFNNCNHDYHVQRKCDTAI